MRRASVALLVIVAMVIPMAAVSAASRPTIVKFPKGTFDLGNLNDGPAGDVCAFPVGGVVQALGGGHAILFSGQGVRYEALGFGALRITITNLDTGKSITVNISGPGGLRGDGTPLVGWGPWVIFEPIARGGIRLFHGRVKFVPTSYGVHGISLSGTVEDLCDRVA
jgi:hypothetical protein